MPNRKIHKQRAALSTLPVHSILINDKEDNFLPNILLELLSLATGMSIGSTLADKFEPAYHPHHRSFLHSPIFGLIMGKAGYNAWQDIQQIRCMRKILNNEKVSLNELINIFLLGISVSYLDHLIADGFTPNGLPLY